MSAKPAVISTTAAIAATVLLAIHFSMPEFLGRSEPNAR
jgi:hypothetical protein